ncbi:MAG: hypothetical protein K2N49_02315 [Ruminococcus sp.]|nr:hypothetical protein [Ruminococcus sp.]MDE7225681.1 hypothetical protein [Ruminococcus sp.]
MHEKLTKGIFFGLVGNILFIAFGLLCLLYYYTYEYGSIFTRIMEVLAYSTEIMGFGLLAYADYLLITSIRLRRLLKVSFSAYILLEAVMMILELNAYKIEFYKPYSLPLAIIHAVISAAACFAFLQLDPHNVKWEFAVGSCITLILAGMLGNILGIRIYFSIILSALGFTVLFGTLKFFHDRQQIEIDCYGDRAVERVFNSSTLFSEDESEK